LVVSDGAAVSALVAADVTVAKLASAI
jgi:hypothetical protein